MSSIRKNLLIEIFESFDTPGVLRMPLMHGHSVNGLGLSALRRAETAPHAWLPQCISKQWIGMSNIRKKSPLIKRFESFEVRGALRLPRMLSCLSALAYTALKKENLVGLTPFTMMVSGLSLMPTGFNRCRLLLFKEDHRCCDIETALQAACGLAGASPGPK